MGRISGTAYSTTCTHRYSRGLPRLLRNINTSIYYIVFNYQRLISCIKVQLIGATASEHTAGILQVTYVCIDSEW